MECSRTSRPPTCKTPFPVTASLLSGVQSSSAALQSLSVAARKSRMTFLFSSGWDMISKISPSESWHSTKVCPKNIRRDTGRHAPDAVDPHSNRKPVRSPKSPKWCVGMNRTRPVPLRADRLWPVARSPAVTSCSAKFSSSISRGCPKMQCPAFCTDRGYLCRPAPPTRDRACSRPRSPRRSGRRARRRRWPTGRKSWTGNSSFSQTGWRICRAVGGEVAGWMTMMCRGCRETWGHRLLLTNN